VNADEARNQDALSPAPRDWAPSASDTDATTIAMGPHGLSRIGRFTVLRLLGSGGFASVYAAEDPDLGRQVAIKLLHEHLARDSSFMARFHAEAQISARLRHPNIVTIYEVGHTTTGQPYLVMELLDGRTLAALIAERGPLPLAEVAPLVTQLASALDYLHAQQLVHRDLKLSNIIVNAAGQLTLMDFGIARPLADAAGLTTGGQALGTPSYMAPEQFQGVTTAASDLYAMGVLLYELLAGRPPFRGPTGAVMHAQLYEAPPPLDQLRPDLPAAVVQAVHRALDKDPTARPAQATTLAHALQSVESVPTTAVVTVADEPTQPVTRSGAILGFAVPQPTIATSQTPSHSMRWLAGAVVGTIAVLLVTILVVAAQRGGANNTPAGRRTTIVASGTVPASNPVVVVASAAPVLTPSLKNLPSPVSTSTAIANPVPLMVSTVQLPNSEAWAQGQADLQACYPYANAPSGTALRVRIAPASDPQSPVADGPLTPLPAAGGDFCNSVPTYGAIPAGNYLALLYDSQWHELARVAFAVRRAATPEPTLVPMPIVAGSWFIVDTVQVGAYRGAQLAFHIVLLQDGNRITGGGDGLSLQGTIDGSVLSASYQQDNGSAGSFRWMLDTPVVSLDGTFANSFDGTFDNSSGNGGRSSGQRTASPTVTVALFYTYIGAQRYADAYALLSSRYRAQQPYDSWRAGYTTTRGAYDEAVSEASQMPEQVNVTIVATDLINGQTVVRRFAGTWTLVQEPGGWRLDSARIQQVP